MFPISKEEGKRRLQDYVKVAVSLGLRRDQLVLEMPKDVEEHLRFGFGAQVRSRFRGPDKNEIEWSVN